MAYLPAVYDRVTAQFASLGVMAFKTLLGIDGSAAVYVQQTRPTEPGPWQWWETDAAGNVIDLIINDGNP